MPREADQVIDQVNQPSYKRAVRRKTIQLGCFQGISMASGDTCGQTLQLVRTHSQGLAHVPQRAFWPVRDDGRGQGGALAPVFFIDVSNDLFTTFMFKVHVNIRRFIAFPGNKALKQQVHGVGVDFCYAQAITGGGVGGGTAPLAQDTLAAGKPHNIVNRQKIMLIAELLHQGQLMFNQCPHFFRCAPGPARLHTLFREPSQP